MAIYKRHYKTTVVRSIFKENTQQRRCICHSNNTEFCKGKQAGLFTSICFFRTGVRSLLSASSRLILSSSTSMARLSVWTVCISPWWWLTACRAASRSDWSCSNSAWRLSASSSRSPCSFLFCSCSFRSRLFSVILLPIWCKQKEVFQKLISFQVFSWTFSNIAGFPNLLTVCFLESQRHYP